MQTAAFMQTTALIIIKITMLTMQSTILITQDIILIMHGTVLTIQTAAFMQITKDRPITEDDMRGWFANAIENGHDAKMRRKRSCLNCGETQKNDGPFCNQTEDGCTQEVSEAYCCGKWYPAN